MKMRTVIFTVLGFSALLLIGFANVSNDRRVCHKVIISITNQLDNHFIDDNDVLALMTFNNSEVVEGAIYADLNVRELENRVKTSRYVKDAEIFRDLTGNMLVNVMLRRPVARIIENNGPGAYIAEDGIIMPVSEKFSSRVLLVSGAIDNTLSNLDNINGQEFEQLFALINYINDNKFWKAQIAQIEVQENKEVKLLPQVTKQDIEFGDINDIENKFYRLDIFYKEILPRKGWNSYSRVNVKYKNQIICE